MSPDCSLSCIPSYALRSHFVLCHTLNVCERLWLVRLRVLLRVIA